jgi:undecaprenol kinase/diacylglycerol kinase (ATP)
MRIHVSFAVVVFALGLLLRLTTMEMALLVVAVALVFVAEVSNTALEEAVNLASPVHHPLARMSKDAAAGAVLLAAAAAIVVGVLVIGPHLWALL